jgi:signal transduction histidine kinase
MTSLRRALIALGAAGFAAGLVAMVLVLASDWQRDQRAVNLLLGPLVGWAFIGAGLAAWRRRPDNRFGALMTAVGFAWFAGALAASDAPGLFIVGVALSPLPFALLVHTLLAFPSGRVAGKWARRLLVLGYIDVLVVLPIGILFADTQNPDICTDGCPPNPVLVSHNDTVGQIAVGIYGILTLLVLIGAVLLLVGRWRRAPAPQRRVLGPLYLTGGATLIFLLLTFATDQAAGDSVTTVVNAISIVLLASVPFAFLVGLLRTNLARASAVSEIVGGRRDLREALAAGLGDPSLELAYWLPNKEHYVDRDGRLVELPEEGSRRAATLIEHDGRCIAAIIHDPALAHPDQQPLVQAAGAAAALALENERLDAELRARVEELQSSRARIVEAGLAERRRLERDLHDGAQQRLVALRLQLRLARDQVGKDPAAAEQMLDGAMQELDEALAELRELARGIHPAVLADRGLEPALSALAGRAPLPVEVKGAPEERLPARVEAAAYFVVAEALTNVARYSQATRATIAVERRNGHAVVEVSDDGIGGADPSRGTGLTGLADRLAALDGKLHVDSPEGGGTIVRADIPCG